MRKAAGLFIIAKDTKKALLLYRSKISPQPHTWCPTGGGCDPGETLLDCAKRECEEEVGYKGEMITVPFFKHIYKTFQFVSFLAIVPKQFEVKLDLYENEKYKWVTKKELFDITPKHCGLENILKENECLDMICPYL